MPGSLAPRRRPWSDSGREYLFPVRPGRAGAGRAGALALGHGTVMTPCFMPVGTNASVKAMDHASLEGMGINLILGNTYHLYLGRGER